MVKDLLIRDLTKAIKSLGFESSDIVLSISEKGEFGDYTTNSPLQLAKQNLDKSYQSPLEIAKAIVEKLGHPIYLERIDIAGPGFLNFFITDQHLIENLETKIDKAVSEKKILVEYAHPNTHKAFHIGHLRNITIGESISRLLEFQGVEVFRATYGGDIGPHVAKAIWGVLQLKDEYQELKDKLLREKAEFLGKAYVLGAAKYEEDADSKEDIDQINEKLYQKDPDIVQIWQETKKISIDYFESLYSKLGTKFDAQIWESEVEERGKKVVEENLGKVFIENEGAIIFPGEKYGLHTRVFITSKGYPLYEAKELGLTEKEEELFPFDLSLHIVGSEQAGYFQVVIKALELINSKRTDQKKHLSYGMVNLVTGKMSSRKGEVITADSLISEVTDKIIKNANNTITDTETLEKIALAAIKFGFLKYSLISQIAFDIDKSISLQGDSGLYVMYAYTRTNSLLKKATTSSSTKLNKKTEIGPEERELLRLIEYFDTSAKKAADEYQPNELANYLLDLAKAFNSFYEKYPIIGSKEEVFRLRLVKKTNELLKMGLYLLGIEAVERM